MASKAAFIFSSLHDYVYLFLLQFRTILKLKEEKKMPVDEIRKGANYVFECLL